MVDGTSYNRICANFAWEAPKDEAFTAAAVRAEETLSAEEFAKFKARQEEERAARVLNDEERLLATNVLRGFSFVEKRWFLMFIDNFAEITWNEVRWIPPRRAPGPNRGHYRHRLIG